MRSTLAGAATALTAAALTAAALIHRTRTAPPEPIDFDLVIDGARRVADALESGDPIMQGLMTHGSDLVDVDPGLGQALAAFADPDHLAPRPRRPISAGAEVTESLHDWLASGNWDSPDEVLEVLRDQAPISALADLLRDLASDLETFHQDDMVTVLRQAEQLLEQASTAVGEGVLHPAAPVAAS